MVFARGMPVRILVAEDSDTVRKELVKTIRAAGFEVDDAKRGNDADIMLKSCEYDAVVLSLDFQDVDALALLRTTLRSELPDLPCLALSSQHTLENCVAALNAGADDYILKPFAASELIARLRAVLRRAGSRSKITREYGNISIDVGNRTLFIAGKPVIFTRRELMLLEELIDVSPDVLIKERLEGKLSSYGTFASLNAIEALISRLRRKLVQAEANCRIKSVYGYGYRLVLIT